MKKFITILLIIIIWTLTCATSGYFYAKKTVKPITIKQTETQWKYSVIYKDISQMPSEEKDRDLQCYYQSEFHLNFTPLVDDNKYRITGKLCQREAYKDIEIECHESGNFKFYLGLGVAATVGAGIYILTR